MGRNTHILMISQSKRSCTAIFKIFSPNGCIAALVRYPTHKSSHLREEKKQNETVFFFKMRRDYEKNMPNLKITRSSQPQQFDHTAIMASRPQCERWRKTSHPCVVEAKTPDTPGGGRFRLQLRYTRRKGDRSVKKLSLIHI